MADPTQEIETLRGLVWRLSDELGKVELDKANAEGDPNEWPAGQSWDELNSTSHSIMRRRAWTVAGLQPLEVVALLCVDGGCKPYDEQACAARPSSHRERTND